MWGYMGGGGMGFGMLLFWGLLIFALVALGRYFWGSGTGSGRDGEKSALALLKERYARGEIEQEEFEQKQRDLKS